MKLPKNLRRFCPFCKAHTQQKVSLASAGHTRSALKRGSIARAKKRGLGRGMGNLGKWGSKPPVTQWKRKTKSTKKANIIYTCSVCHKSYYKAKGIRSGKVQLEEKKKKEGDKEKTESQN